MPSTKTSVYLTLFLTIAVLLIAYWLRLSGLGDVNLIWDEGYSNWIVKLPYGEMLQRTAADVHPPLYYTILRGGMALFGASEFGMRYPSVLLSMIGVALVFGLGRAVGGFRVGLIAMLMIAVARANIDISQLARMHIVATLFGITAIWSALRLWKDHTRVGASIVYVISAAGALYSFYLAVMIPVATNLGFLYVWWRRGYPRDLFVRWVGLNVAAAILFAPWALYAVSRMHGWNAGADTNFWFFIRVYFVTLFTGDLTDWGPYVIWIGATLLLLTGGFYLIFRQARLHKNTLKEENLALLIAVALAPIIVVFPLTLPIHNLGRPFVPRYVVLLTGGFYVLVAWAVVRLMRRQVIVGVISGVLVFGLLITGLTDTMEKQVLRDSYASIAGMLKAHRQPEDAVVLHTDNAWTVFQAVYDAPRIGIPHETFIGPALANFILEPVWAESEVVWLVENPESLANDPNQEVKAWLEERAVHIDVWELNDNKLHVYVKDEARIPILYNLVEGYSLPETPLDEDIGLIKIEQPRRRYPLGDDILLTAYWQREPGAPVTIELVGQGVQESYSFDMPDISSGAIRQQISIPTSLELPEGDYDLYMTSPERRHISTVEVVSFSLDVSARESDIQHRLGWRFGEHVELVGYSINDDTFSPGDLVEVTLYWRTDAVLEERYKVLVYAIGDFNPQTNNPLWGQQDSEPLNWQYPTTQWPSNTLIEDVYRFPMQEDTPPGEYGLGVVMYYLVGGERLQITDSDGQPLGDTFTMQTIEIN